MRTRATHADDRHERTPRACDSTRPCPRFTSSHSWEAASTQATLTEESLQPKNERLRGRLSKLFCLWARGHFSDTVLYRSPAARPMPLPPPGPHLGLCSLPVGVRAEVASFLEPRVCRYGYWHPLAAIVRELDVRVELPAATKVYWRRELQLWTQTGGELGRRPGPIWPRRIAPVLETLPARP